MGGGGWGAASDPERSRRNTFIKFTGASSSREGEERQNRTKTPGGAQASSRVRAPGVRVNAVGGSARCQGHLAPPFRGGRDERPLSSQAFVEHLARTECGSRCHSRNSLRRPQTGTSKGSVTTRKLGHKWPLGGPRRTSTLRGKKPGRFYELSGQAGPPPTGRRPPEHQSPSRMHLALGLAGLAVLSGCGVSTSLSPQLLSPQSTATSRNTGNGQSTKSEISETPRWVRPAGFPDRRSGRRFHGSRTVQRSDLCFGSWDLFPPRTSRPHRPPAQRPPTAALREGSRSFTTRSTREKLCRKPRPSPGSTQTPWLSVRVGGQPRPRGSWGSSRSPFR